MRTALLVILLLAIAIAASAQSKKENASMKVEQELRSLVHTWDDAYAKGDTLTLGRLLADEFAFVGGPNKAEYLASFKASGVLIDSAVSTDVEVKVYDKAAVVTGLDTITGKNKGQSFMVKWLYLDVWIKKGGRWQCVKTYSMPAQK